MLALTTIALSVAALIAAASPDACGGGWGQWSVPINTLLLIVLGAVNLRTRRNVEKVKAVTDTVKLRHTPRQVSVGEEREQA